MGADYLWASMIAPPSNLSKEEALDKLNTAIVRLYNKDEYKFLAQEIPVSKDEALEAFEYLWNAPRDLGYLDTWDSTGKYIELWHSGGMSWGDSPTEAFDYICILTELYRLVGEIW